MPGAGGPDEILDIAENFSCLADERSDAILLVQEQGFSGFRADSGLDLIILPDCKVLISLL